MKTKEQKTRQPKKSTLRELERLTRYEETLQDLLDKVDQELRGAMSAGAGREN